MKRSREKCVTDINHFREKKNTNVDYKNPDLIISMQLALFLFFFTFSSPLSCPDHVMVALRWDPFPRLPAQSQTETLALDYPKMG